MSRLIHRLIEQNVSAALKRGKSILLLGPRQTGKTTFVENIIKPDFSYSFAKIATRQRYESQPVLLEKELEAYCATRKTIPTIFIDEVQKIPLVMDIAQHLIDHKLAKFILSGSSARKLKNGYDVNLLPGRVVSLNMSPFLYQEIPSPKPELEELLIYGTLPAIITENDNDMRETDLHSYVSAYLEEEIRAEAAVRNIGSFTRFLQVAAGEVGTVHNFTRISQDVGVADTTIANYYQILEDCLIAHRIDPIIKSQTQRRLIKSPKYIFFDLGIRRICANEGTRLSQNMLGHLFEHFIGTELLYNSQLTSPGIKLRYWKDSAGPEVDYVLDHAQQYTPIEVKYTDKPTNTDARHLIKFLDEYSGDKAYIICRTPHRFNVNERVIALPWQQLSEVF